MKKWALFITIIVLTLIIAWCKNTTNNNTAISYTTAECEELWENTVCGKDGYSYVNECYLNFYGSEKSDLAEVIEWECIYEWELKECSEMEEKRICGEDYIMYYNECFLNANWIEKSETAVPVDPGVCVD